MNLGSANLCVMHNYICTKEIFFLKVLFCAVENILDLTSGSYFGTVIALPLCGVLAQSVGWPWVFYVFGKSTPACIQKNYSS